MTATIEYRYEFAAASFEVHNLTTTYRVRIAWADGRETWIGDYPTRRIAARAAEDFILANRPVSQS